MTFDNTLVNLNIKHEFFNTKFLFYNYYQFNKQKKIPINYRTPYCILDGIYFELHNLTIRNIYKYKGNNKFNIELIIPKNNNIIPKLIEISHFNTKFYDNIKLPYHIKRKRTLKNSIGSSNHYRKNIHSFNYNDTNIENDLSDTELNNDVFSNDNSIPNNNVNIQGECNNDNNDNIDDRFNNINLFCQNANKYYKYKDYLLEYKDNYILNCEIKPEFCQKLFYKLRNDLNFSTNINNDVKQSKINVCNDIIKLCNIEYFKFNVIEKSWDCSNWNININTNIKSNSFQLDNDNDGYIFMNWKICSYSL